MRYCRQAAMTLPQANADDEKAADPKQHAGLPAATLLP